MDYMPSKRFSLMRRMRRMRLKILTPKRKREGCILKE